MIERKNIGIFGKVNSGKSSIMNLLTQQECSIVDSKPGTTADTKITLCEIHSIGPVKIFDTAGMDEIGLLGEKKRKKAENNLKECDLILLVIDPSAKEFETENNIISKAREYGSQLLVVYNIFSDKNDLKSVEKKIKYSEFYKKISISAISQKERQRLIDFIIENFMQKEKKLELLPFIEKDNYYLLNIPMDIQTPPGRYLRPQAMAEEYITRKFAFPISYRMDLGTARGKDFLKEKKRYLGVLTGLKDKKIKCVITDSQAIDIVDKWTPKDIKITTFSIMMINYASGGRISLFARGIKAMDSLKKGDKILIAEACNHSRIGEDIGTVQIPNFINKNYQGVVIEHNFGREFKENTEISNYSLIVHCGACMIDQQKLAARLRDLETRGIPITNYGIFLAFMQGKDALKRVLEPWGIG